MINRLLFAAVLFCVACDDPTGPQSFEPSEWTLRRINGEAVPGASVPDATFGNPVTVLRGGLLVAAAAGDAYHARACPERPSLAWSAYHEYMIGQVLFAPGDHGCIVGDRFYSYLHRAYYDARVSTESIVLSTADLSYEFARDH